MWRAIRVFTFMGALLGLIFTVKAQSFDLPGYIAVLGDDFNVYVVGSDFTTPAPLTRDASPIRHYQFPTWSMDGRLAFFCCDALFAPEITLETYVASADLTATKLIYYAENEGYTYAQWSPANCSEGDHCRDLALLITRPTSSFRVDILRQNALGVTTHTVATGAPFYFSWRGDGRQMIWHRNNRLLSFFDVETDIITDDVTVAHFFQAPAWSQTDNRVAVVVQDTPSSVALVLLEDGQQRVLKGGLPQGLMNFSWSPDGHYLAYRLITSNGITAVEVLDAETGAVAASSVEPNAIAFFWSPDSTRLAYLTPDQSGGASDIPSTMMISTQPQRYTFNWAILDIASNRSRVIATFVPTETMVYLLGYFDQFSQSHQLWSPDSRYLVYGEVADASIHRVSFVDTLTETPSPVSLMSGEIGIWSYND